MLIDKVHVTVCVCMSHCVYACICYDSSYVIYIAILDLMRITAIDQNIVPTTSYGSQCRYRVSGNEQQVFNWAGIHKQLIVALGNCSQHNIDNTHSPTCFYPSS